MATGDDAKDAGHAAMEGTPPPPKAVIVLTLHDNMTVNVQFPNDEILARFLLDKGTDAIRNEWTRRSMPLVTEANGARPGARGMLPQRRIIG